jgi:hypothetical protein
MLAVFGLVSAVFAVSAMSTTSAMFRQGSAHGEGDGKND